MGRDIKRKANGQFAPTLSGAAAPTAAPPAPPARIPAGGGHPAPAPDGLAGLHEKFTRRIAAGDGAARRELEEAAGDVTETVQLSPDGAEARVGDASVCWRDKGQHFAVVDNTGAEVATFTAADEAVVAASHLSRGGREGFALVSAVEEVCGGYDDFEKNPRDGTCTLTVGDSVTIEWKPGVGEFVVGESVQSSPQTFWSPAQYRYSEVLMTTDPEEAAQMADSLAYGDARDYEWDYG